MTVDESAHAGPDAVTAAPSDDRPRRTTQQQAVAAYTSRIRTWRRAYAAILVAVVVATIVLVKIAYMHGEISHATLKTVKTPPASVAAQAPAQTVTPAWQTSDRSALGQPFWGGTAITATDHSVRGRNALTGAITWSYTRTDRPLCDAIQDYGTTIAFFSLHGNCDEVTALDSQTGARKWARTLDKDDTRDGQLGDGIKGIQHIIGHPTYAISQYSLLVITPDVIYNLDPSGGLDRWTFAWSGCTIHGAVFGSQGALISQTCANVKCGSYQFCGNGPQLLLRKGTDARADDSKNKTNPDQLVWNRLGLDVTPVSADQVISAADGSASVLTVFDAAKGATLGTLRLQGGSAPGAVAQLNTSRAEVVWIGGVTYAIQTSGSDFLWKASAAGPPSVTALPGSETTPVDLDQATVLVAAGDGVDALDPHTGKTARHYAVAPPTAGSSVYPLGSGFVVSGDSTAVYR